MLTYFLLQLCSLLIIASGAGILGGRYEVTAWSLRSLTCGHRGMGRERGWRGRMEERMWRGGEKGSVPTQVREQDCHLKSKTMDHFNYHKLYNQISCGSTLYVGLQHAVPPTTHTLTHTHYTHTHARTYTHTHAYTHMHMHTRTHTHTRTTHTHQD